MNKGMTPFQNLSKYCAMPNIQQTDTFSGYHSYPFPCTAPPKARGVSLGRRLGKRLGLGGVAICAMLFSTPFLMGRSALAEQLPENRTASFFSQLMPHAGEELIAQIPMLPAAQAPVANTQESQLPTLPKPFLMTLIEGGKIDGQRIAQPEDIKRFYTERNGQYLWVKDGRYTGDAKKIYELISSAAAHGLNPQNYRAEYLNARINARFADEPQAAEAELAMSDALARLGGDLSGMRLPPALIKADKNSWSAGAAAYSLLRAVENSRDPAALIEKLAPQDETYRALQKELAALIKQAAAEQATTLPKLPVKLKTLKPGQQSPAVGILRTRLDPQSIVVSDIYDEELQEKVIAFQIDHGLKGDGVIGPRTLLALNEGTAEKIIKVIANLERRRWVRRPLPPKYIEVNIPAMQLQAVENGRTQFTMPVVVGRPKRPTMSFVDEIVGIRFNPSWYVPDTIKKEDYLPMLRKNPQALAEKGIAFRVYSAEYNRMIDVSPEDIDWQNTSSGGLRNIQMVQGPGAANALGVIRVLMPNQYDIYLHDTNTPGLFQKDDRAQSSGCVRLAEPRRIANFILDDNAGWNDKQLDAQLKRGKTNEIHASKAVPVYLLYFTMWRDDAGKLIYGQDIYNLDKALVDALKQQNKLPFLTILKI